MEIYVFIDGAKKSLTQLAAESGESYDTILRRYKAGVPADQLVPKKETGETGSTAPPGIGVPLAGYVYFDVSDDGHLICTYTGDEQPNYSIRSDGHLILEL